MPFKNRGERQLGELLTIVKVILGVRVRAVQARRKNAVLGVAVLQERVVVLGAGVRAAGLLPNLPDGCDKQ